MAHTVVLFFHPLAKMQALTISLLLNRPKHVIDIRTVCHLAEGLQEQSKSFKEKLNKSELAE